MYIIRSPNKEYCVNVSMLNTIAFDLYANSQRDRLWYKNDFNYTLIISRIEQRIADFYRLQIAGKCGTLFKMYRSKDHRAIVVTSATRQREIES